MTETGYEDEGTNPLQVQVLELAKSPMGMIRRRWLWMLLALVGVSAASVWIWTQLGVKSGKKHGSRLNIVQIDADVHHKNKVILNNDNTQFTRY